MQVYPQVMHEVLGELGEYGIFSGRNSNGYRTNAMIGAILQTSHTRLINATLYNKHSGSDTVQMILDDYIRQGRLDMVLEYLKSLTDERRSYDLSEFVGLMVIDSNDSFIIDFLSLGKDSLRYVKDIISLLYKQGRRELADSLIDTYIEENLRVVLKTIVRIRSGDTIPEAQIMLELKDLFEPVVEEKDKLEFMFNDTIMSGAHGVINALGDTDYDILALKNIYIRVKSEAKKSSKHSLQDFDLEERIRSHLVGEKDYDAALDFVEACGDRYYYKVDVLTHKLLDGGLAADDAEGVIGKIVEILDSQIAKYEEVRAKENKDVEDENKNKDEDGIFNLGGYLRTNYEYINRVNVYKAYATKFSYLVIYELLHGTKEKADEYITQMIDWVEKIRIPGKDNAPIQHQKSLARLSRREKRGIRERFFHLGLLDHLPKNGGWSDTMQDPRIREEKRRKQREDFDALSQKRQDEAELKNKNNYAERILSYMRLINDDKLDEAIELLKKNVDYRAYSRDWQGAALILEKRPDAFIELFNICTEALEKIYKSRDKLSGMEWFLYEAIKLGSLDDEKTLDHFISRLLKVYRDHDRGTSRVLGSVTINLVSRLIRSGEIQKAWDFFMFFKNDVKRGQSWEVVPREAEDECMALFISAFSNQKEGGISKSLRGDFGGLVDGEHIEYYNTQVEMALALGEDEKASRESEILRSHIVSTNDAKEWIRLMNAGSLRSEHTKKDELQAVYAQTDDVRTKWRIVDAMIDAKIPGVESLPEIQSKNTPIEITRYFLKKLIANKVLHDFTESFIDKDEHIPYLRRLLSEFQNEFNTVMETLYGLYSAHASQRVHDTQDGAEIHLDDIYKKSTDIRRWDNILLVLRLVGAFTPGIYAQAQKVEFDKVKLGQIGEDISAMKERLFTNNPINDEIARDLMAEIIYSAYKPANMTLWDVRGLCRKIRDCSHHLDEYTFQDTGYKLDFSTRKTMKLRKSGDILESVASTTEVMHFFQNSQKSEVSGDAAIVQSQARVLIEMGRLKMTDEMKLEDICAPFLEDVYFKVLVMTIGGSDNDRYKQLRESQEGYGVYMRDNIEERIAEFFFTNETHVSEMLSSFVKSLKTPKRQRVIKQQLGLDLQEYGDLDDNELAAKVISQVVLQKFKPLQELNRKIKRDISKFVAEDGGEAVLPDSEYRAVFSKNISSFFAKSSAGICTDQDTSLFHREDHFHINIIDDTKNVCVGNVQGYIMEKDGKNYLLLRGFNPSTNLLKVVDPGGFCEAVLDVCKGFSSANNLEGIILSENLGWHALSNRGAITQYLEKAYRPGEIEIPNFSITNSKSISNGYLVPS